MLTKVSIEYIINLTTRKEVSQLLDMFDILELPKEETKEVEQFTPLEQVEENPTEQTESIETVSKQDYDNLVKTIEELKTLLTTNKE